MTNELDDLKRRLLSDAERFSIADAEKYVADIHVFRNVDTTEKFHKRFFHEFIPLLDIAKHVGGAEIEITAYNSATIDGYIFFKDGRSPQSVELTIAEDGREEALRMELLKQRGYAPGLGPIEATGTKYNRVFGSNEGEAYSESADSYLGEKQYDLMINAKEKKMRKDNPDYRGAWLGIVLPNFPPGADRKKNFYDPLCKRLLADSHEPFSRVFCVCVNGTSCEYLFDSDSLL